MLKMRNLQQVRDFSLNSEKISSILADFRYLLRFLGNLLNNFSPIQRNTPKPDNPQQVSGAHEAFDQKVRVRCSAPRATRAMLLAVGEQRSSLTTMVIIHQSI